VRPKGNKGRHANADDSPQRHLDVDRLCWPGTCLQRRKHTGVRHSLTYITVRIYVVAIDSRMAIAPRRGIMI
jgi:hypothetical protein